MSQKRVIPPVSMQTSSTETMEVLEKRMYTAEQDTQQLVDQLARMGFAPDKNKPSGGDVISPFKVQVSEEDLRKNYEGLVSRVCKAESAVQTLKLTLMRVQADRDLSRKEKKAVSEKLSMAADAYETEINKQNRELSQLRKECKEVWDLKKEMDDQLKQSHAALEESYTTTATIKGEMDNMASQKLKLQRRVSEMKEELGRECSMRGSLEESHKSLLQRIQDMEGIVEAERDEVKKLSSNCVNLKRDSAQARDEADVERNLREQLQNQIQRMNANEEFHVHRVSELEEDRELLMQEVGRIRAQYNDLNTQLDLMKNILEDKQATHSQLESEKKSLHEAMTSTANKNAALIARYESLLEAGRKELATHLQDEELVQELQEKLKEQSVDNGQLQQKCTQLELQVKDLQSKVKGQEKQLSTATKQQDKDTSHWKKQIQNLEQEKERALKDKEALLDEVNQAVDSMAEEKSRLECHIEECRLEMTGLENSKAALETENRRLLEKVNSLEESKVSQQQIEQSIKEMLDQKNKLAYDKGKLESKVEQLQRDMENLATAQVDLNQLRKLHSSTETKLNKNKMELQEAEMTVQRLESQVSHHSKTTDRKEKDFELAIKARDEALKDLQRLQSHVESLEARDRQKTHGLQHNLEDMRGDNKKLSGTLEGVMQSHTRLQQTMETLQVELGRKDAHIADINKEKLDLQHNVYQLTKEAESLQNQLTAVQTYETSEVGPIRRTLQQCKTDNTKMAGSMETLMKSNGQLQAAVDNLEDKLEQKSHLLNKIHTTRDEEEESHKQEVRMLEERITNFKQQLMKERDKSLKKTNKEVAEVRKQLDDIISKNGDLSKANSDLRHKITELEYTVKEQKEKVVKQRTQIEHLSKMRQKQDEAVRHMQGITEQIRELEKSKAFYVKKNKEQESMLQTFMSQIPSLQAEIQTLAKSQMESSVILQDQEEQLTRERHGVEQWKRKYQEAKKREGDLESLRKQMEQKLREANNESMMFSEDHHDAHSWFKSKFTNLQSKLTSAKKSQMDVEKENVDMKNMLDEEKRRAEETSRRAQAMIKASRETISRLANHAEDSYKAHNNKMYELKEQLEAEKENSFLYQRKLAQFQDASLRHTEELARELEYLKTQTLSYDST